MHQFINIMLLKNKKNVKINKFTMGIELEVCYLIKKDFFRFKKKVSKIILKNLLVKSHLVLKLLVIDKKRKVSKV